MSDDDDDDDSEVVLDAITTPRRPETLRGAFLSASLTLTLSILGSSVLPVGYAFSRTGVLLGFLTAALVAAMNSVTGALLLNSANALSQRASYGALCLAVGGPTLKAVALVSNVLLLFGNLAGDFALLADAGRLSVADLFAGEAPGWLVRSDGRVIMTILAIFVVLPLSLTRHMRQLERVATAGVVMVVVLAAVVVRSAVVAGMPAVKSGELPLLQVRWTADVPEAVTVLSFT
jgi:solute carrier family 38 (sodium-coupled neutral amino acid transporter), member 11